MSAYSSLSLAQVVEESSSSDSSIETPPPLSSAEEDFQLDDHDLHSVFDRDADTQFEDEAFDEQEDNEQVHTQCYKVFA